MKEYILGAALVVILSFTFLASVDINRYLEQDEIFDSCLQDSVNAASLFYDYSEFGEGNKVFIDEEAIKAIDRVLGATFDLDASTGRYLNSAFDRYITIYDDSLKKRDYKNGSLVSTTDFTYGIKDTDQKGVIRDILDPTIIVYVNAGHPEMQLRIFRDKIVMHDSVAYVYQEDNF